MPIYEYRCQVCRELQEHRLPVDERDSPPRCDCGGGLKRLPQAPTWAPFPGSYEHSKKPNVRQAELEGDTMKPRVSRRWS